MKKAVFLLPAVASLLALSSQRSIAQTSVQFSSANTQVNPVAGSRAVGYEYLSPTDPSQYWSGNTLVVDDGEWTFFDAPTTYIATSLYPTNPASSPYASQGSVFSSNTYPTNSAFYVSYTIVNNSSEALYDGSPYSGGPWDPRTTVYTDPLYTGEGYTFTIQSTGDTKCNPAGLGDGGGITDGLSIHFNTDTYDSPNNVSTSAVLNLSSGVSISLPCTVNSNNPSMLASEDPINVQISYDGSKYLTVILTNTVTGLVDNRVYDTSDNGTINGIAGALENGPDAYFGFTRGGNSAAMTSAVTVTNWQYNSAPPTAVNAYWPFSEGTGTTSADMTGNGNALNLQSSSMWSTAGKYGDCLSFNGTNQYAAVSNSTLGNIGTGNFTISAWVNTTSTNDQMFVAKQTSNNSNGLFNFGCSEGKVFCQIQGNSGSNQLFFWGGRTINDGNWHFVTMVRSTSGSTSTLTAYVDGVQDDYVTGTAASSVSNTQPLDIGCAESGTTPVTLFTGLIDDVRIFNSALDVSQIEALYNEPLAAWSYNVLPLSSTAAATDVSGNQNALNLYGSASYSAAGEVGECLDLDDATNTYAAVSNSTLGNIGSSNFSISTWVQTSSSNDQMFVAKQTSNNSNGLFNFGCSAGEIFVQIQGNSGANQQYMYGGSTINDGKWHLATMVRNGLTITDYIDGVQDETHTTTGTAASVSNTQPLDIGCAESGTGPVTSFTGFIDETKIFGSALDIYDIQALYASPTAHWKFNEGTGNASADSTGDDNTLTLSGTSWSSSGESGDCLSFAGSGTATVNNANLGNFENGNFSISAWIDTSNSSSTEQFIAAKRSSSSGYGYFDFGTANGKTFAEVDDSTGSDYQKITGSTTITGGWHLITFVRSGSNLDIYVDGNTTADATNTSTDTTPIAAITNSQAMDIGSYAAGSSNYFTGSIDEVRMYNYALTSTEISEKF